MIKVWGYVLFLLHHGVIKIWIFDDGWALRYPRYPWGVGGFPPYPQYPEVLSFYLKYHHNEILPDPTMTHWSQMVISIHLKCIQEPHLQPKIPPPPHESGVWINGVIWTFKRIVFKTKLYTQFFSLRDHMMDIWEGWVCLTNTTQPDLNDLITYL